MTKDLKIFMNDLADNYANSFNKPKDKVFRYENNFLLWNVINYASIVTPDRPLREAVKEVERIYTELEAECKTK